MNGRPKRDAEKHNKYSAIRTAVSVLFTAVIFIASLIIPDHINVSFEPKKAAESQPSVQTVEPEPDIADVTEIEEPGTDASTDTAESAEEMVQENEPSYTAEAEEAPEETITEPDDVPKEEPEEFIPNKKTDTYYTVTLSDEDTELLERCVFIGDSICSGLSYYGVLPDENVLAAGNIAARNIFDYGDGEFVVNGYCYGIIDALSALPYTPEYVVFSMGMNDINMGDGEYFIDNYRTLIGEVRSVLPDAKLVICSITPISSDCTFSSNEIIDSFNKAVSLRCPSIGARFADVSTRLKGSDNSIKPDYHSGDGIHLAPEAYKMFLYTVCRRISQ